MLAFAEYCFNKSHSTAYGFVTYQTAYLKTHYPVEYMTSLFMSCNGDTDRIKGYIIDAQRLGIKVVPPDVNLSNVDFRAIVNDKSIVFGLKAIKGVGDGPSQAIVDERNDKGDYKNFFDFCRRVDHKKVNKKTIESLVKCGAFDALGAGRKAMMDNLESFISGAKRTQSEASRGQFGLFADTIISSPNYINGEKDEYPERETQSMEYELLGLYVNNHPMEAISDLVTCVAENSIKALEDKSDGAKIKIAALITDFTKKITKTKKNICILNLEDLESRVEGVVFSRKLEEFEPLIEKGKRVLISGTLSKHSEGDHSVMVDSIEDLDGMGIIEFDVDIDQLQDYYQFFHSLKSYISKPSNQGRKIIILNLISEKGSRKLSLGAKSTMADFEVTVEGLKKIISNSYVNAAVAV